ASGCSKFRKEKSLSEWEIYRRGAQASIDSLRDLRSIEFEGENLPAYRAALAKTEQTVNQFLIESRETGRASRAEIEAALRDLKIIAELEERSDSKSNHYASDKLFSDADGDLFRRVKKNYKVGPALIVAEQSYYFIHSIVPEAWSSAGDHIARAQ